ncbi:hypothetical protein [Paenibacillus elgii]|uniref:hypothetical protein n=1 Tax=Paenibacillus elgii TaxID=189691 RepID=UPI001EF82EA9|nr:hypothetical protein [Paenibacillus elgii]
MNDIICFIGFFCAVQIEHKIVRLFGYADFGFRQIVDTSIDINAFLGFVIMHSAAHIFGNVA